jgi:N utilization substance protein A
VAVFSRERDVDPVGACVGMKGTRVQSIIRELRGEKIDIVEFSEDPIAFVTNALSPAKVQRVSIVDDREHVMEVVVEDKQLSLAIGKKGQNVRLAAKLTGWRIDIKSEEEKRREVEAQFGELESAGEGASETAEAGEDQGDSASPEAGAEPSVAADETPLPYALAGVSDKTVRKLVDGGFATLESLAAATAEQLSEIPGVGGKTAEKILAAARGDAATPGETVPAAGDGNADL